ncbi:DUF2461 domain-containing protein [Flavitalea sp. BT771]|uniref:DUF2461 domain-containing protein n=1 Tax=Flavitalea sp. BT771 TaxID=3063329 RepID=UPI0026E2E8D3|nr:DUF2461 domain-containing protein [Flavitalea sp. BT771]MDO6434757.1 DUF2461 domain-containing protein [Flavitalea sp. BT771]MDV6223657.1 DUF2461 domain-containing protein [Flavitalea sp. BT771]
MQKKEALFIYQSGFDFLNKLKKNNNREWFNAHKAAFQKELLLVEAFAEGLLRHLNVHDMIETPSGKKSLYRIYRDTRFSSDKTPYKTHWSGSFRRATKYRRGGYHFHIEPGNTYIAGGFWGPVPQDLRRIRDDIAFDAAPLRKILKNKTFVSMFKTLQGEQLKTAPQGFDAGHEAIDLLRYKQFLLIRPFSDKEVLAKDFLKEANLTFKAMRPFFDHMSEVLVTDRNGMAI